MELTHSAGQECVSVCFFPARPRCVQNLCNYTERPPPTFVYLSQRTRCSLLLLARFRTDRVGKIKNDRANAAETLQHPVELCLIKWRETFQSLQSDLDGTTTHSNTQRPPEGSLWAQTPKSSDHSHGASSSTPRPQRTLTVPYPLYSMYVTLCILSSPRLPASGPAAGDNHTAPLLLVPTFTFSHLHFGCLQLCRLRGSLRLTAHLLWDLFLFWPISPLSTCLFLHKVGPPCFGVFPALPPMTLSILPHLFHPLSPSYR